MFNNTNLNRAVIKKASPTGDSNSHDNLSSAANLTQALSQYIYCNKPHDYEHCAGTIIHPARVFLSCIKKR